MGLWCASLRLRQCTAPVHNVDLETAFCTEAGACLQNFQQQPRKQLLDMLKWLFEEVNDLHAKGRAHGSISLACIMCHPAEGWRLVKSDKHTSLTDAQQDDINQVARVMCFMCLSSEHRRSYQPHHLGGLKNKELLDLIANVPDVRMVADAMFSGRATLAKGLDFHLWHPLAVHAQVMHKPSLPMQLQRLFPLASRELLPGLRLFLQH